MISWWKNFPVTNDMGGVLDSLGQLVIQYPAWSHWIIAAGMLLQGEVTIFVSMYLINNHSLGWLDFIIPALGSIFVADYFLFLLGRILRTTRFSWKFYRKIKPKKRTQFYLYYIRENLNKLILFSKFLLGTNIILIVAIGWAKTKFTRFMRSHFLSVTLWFAAMILVTYSLSSGLYYLKSTKTFKQVEILLGVLVLFIFFGEYLLKKVLGKRIGFDATSKQLNDSSSDEEEEDRT